MAAFFNKRPEYDDVMIFFHLLSKLRSFFSTVQKTLGKRRRRGSMPYEIESTRWRLTTTQGLPCVTFTKTTMPQILIMLSLTPERNYRFLPLPPMLQLLAALKLYGAVIFERVAGDIVTVSQATLCGTVTAVSTSIARDVFRRFVQFPKREDMPGVMRSLYEVAKFPGVTGCIDSSPMGIRSLGGNGDEVYRNRKVVFSFNVQVSMTILT